MKKITLIIALLFSAGELQAQSYEGYIANAYPVWVDLVIPASDGAVTGTYFYKKYGGNIALTGTKIGNKLVLTERIDKKKITGIFNCADFGDSIIGTWNWSNYNPAFSDPPFKVSLFKTNPSFKQFAKIPKTDELVLSNRSTLESKLKSIVCLDESAIEHSNTEMELKFVQKNIFSIRIDWLCPGYPQPGHEYRTFDLTTQKEIVLWNEIDPIQETAFNKYLCKKVQKKLDEHRIKFSDSEWGFKNKEYFSVSDLMHYPFDTKREKEAVFYIENNNLYFVIEGYFGFPRASLAMDLYCDILIPFTELDKYLKPTSILRNLAKKP